MKGLVALGLRGVAAWFDIVGRAVVGCGEPFDRWADRFEPPPRLKLIPTDPPPLRRSNAERVTEAQEKQL